MYKVIECPKCKGKGYIIKKVVFSIMRIECDKCNGRGIIKEMIK